MSLEDEISRILGKVQSDRAKLPYCDSGNPGFCDYRRLCILIDMIVNQSKNPDIRPETIVFIDMKANLEQEMGTHHCPFVVLAIELLGIVIEDESKRGNFGKMHDLR